MKAKNGSAELRLFNKLVGLFLTLQKYEECLRYAQTSLMLSVDLGKPVQCISENHLGMSMKTLGHLGKGV